MAGNLIQVDTVTLTSSSSTIAVNGIDSDDVYMLACSNLIADSSNAEVKLRVNKSSSAQDDSEYDYAFEIISTVTFNTRSGANQDEVYFIDNINTYGGNAIAYLYNFNDASEYSSGTVESVANVSNQELGNQGGWVHTVASASNGITLHLNTGSFNSGTVTLYRVV